MPKRSPIKTGRQSPFKPLNMKYFFDAEIYHVFIATKDINDGCTIMCSICNEAVCSRPDDDETLLDCILNKHLNSIEHRNSNNAMIASGQKNVLHVPHIAKNYFVSTEFTAKLMTMKYEARGKSHSMFRISREADGFVDYYCLVCKRTCNARRMEGVTIIEKRLTQHINGPAHIRNLEKLKEPEESRKLYWLREFSLDGSSSSSDEEEENGNGTARDIFTTPSAVLLNFLLDFMDTSPFLGLEYLVEFVDRNVHCFLCDSTTKLRLPICHMQSETHEANYMLLHFPSVFEFINDMEKKVSKTEESFIAPTNVKKVLMKEVAMVLRKDNEVLLPKAYNQRSVDSDHEKLAQWIAAEKHYSEQDQPQLKNLFNESYVKALMMESVEKIFQEAEKEPVTDEGTLSELTASESSNYEVLK